MARRKRNRIGAGERRRLAVLLIARDGARCFYCEASVSIKDRFLGGFDRGTAATLDRIIPGAEGGKYTLDNCLIACRVCNEERGCRPAEVFLFEVLALRTIIEAQADA